MLGGHLIRLKLYIIPQYGWCVLGSRSLLRLYSSAGRPKISAPFLTSSSVKTKPGEFVPLFTSFGWFVVPRTHYSYGWTKNEVETLLYTNFKPPVVNPDLSSIFANIEPIYAFTKHTPETYRQMQEAIDKWVLSFDSDDPNINSKRAKKDVVQDDFTADIDQYLSTLKLDLQKEISTLPSLQSSPGSTAKPSTTMPLEPIPVRAKRKAASDPAKSYPDVTLIHAWNYFLLKTSAAIPKPDDGLTKKQYLSMVWKQFKPQEKEIYRREYGEILAQGLDIISGKIVPKSKKKK